MFELKRGGTVLVFFPIGNGTPTVVSKKGDLGGPGFELRGD